MKSNYTDAEIVVAIRGGEEEKNAMITWIYQNSSYQNPIFGYIRNNSNNSNNSNPQLKELEIDEIYRNGIMQLVSNILRKKYKEGNSIGAYLFGICRLLWLNSLKSKKEPFIEPLEEGKVKANIESSEVAFLSQEKNSIIQRLLKLLGEPCRTVLKLWTLSYSMKEIAEKVGYKSAGMARKKKHQCLNRLKDIIKENPDLTTYLKK